VPFWLFISTAACFVGAGEVLSVFYAAFQGGRKFKIGFTIKCRFLIMIKKNNPGGLNEYFNFRS